MLFFRRGKSGAWFCPALANPASPTVAEITGGTNLSPAVATISGFETQLNRINQAVLKYTRELQIDGPETFADASMELIEDDGSGTDADSTARQDIFTALAENATGYIVFAPSKNTVATGDNVETWPVKIGAKNRSWSLDAEAARYKVDYAITGDANKNATVA